MSKLDLEFADDIALMSSCYTHMQTKTRQLYQFAARTGLRINKKKTQVLRINSKCKNRKLIDDQKKWTSITTWVLMSVSKEEAVMTLLTEFINPVLPNSLFSQIGK